MAVTYVEIEDRYQLLTADQPVEIAVTIGDGQTGGYLIFLDRKLKGVNKPAKLGKAAELTGKRILVSATVVDEMNTTNWTSVTIVVREGDRETRFGPYSREAAQHLDTISYVIKLVNQPSRHARS